jgi:hypothetical protein
MAHNLAQRTDPFDPHIVDNFDEYPLAFFQISLIPLRSPAKYSLLPETMLNKKQNYPETSIHQARPVCGMSNLSQAIHTTIRRLSQYDSLSKSVITKIAPPTVASNALGLFSLTQTSFEPVTELDIPFPATPLTSPLDIVSARPFASLNTLHPTC